MPNCVGQNWLQATTALIQAGVTPDNGLLPTGNFKVLGYFDQWPVAINWVKAPGVASGIVTAQVPANLATVAFNAAVTLTVSNFPFAVVDRYSAGGYS